MNRTLSNGSRVKVAAEKNGTVTDSGAKLEDAVRTILRQIGEDPESRGA